jgi:hypothetical protein
LVPDLICAAASLASSGKRSIVATTWSCLRDAGLSISSTDPRILVLRVFWLAIVFTSFGLFAPHNLTAGAALFLCAIAVSCAVQVIFELDTPFQGIIRISSAPTRHALEMISR